MKSIISILLLVTSASLAGAAPTVLVNWINSDNYRDAKDSSMDTEKGRQAVLADLQKFIEERSEKLTEAGYSLEMNVTELDLEGEYEPWHGPRFDDIRIIKEIYPARIDFTYKITDANGQVVKEGEEQLSSFGDFPPFTTNWEQYAYTKQLLRDWLNQQRRLAR